MSRRGIVDDPLHAFGWRFWLARRAAGHSLRAVAAKLDPPLSPQAVSAWQAGHAMPRSAHLVQTARICGVSVDFLMGGDVTEADIRRMKERHR